MGRMNDFTVVSACFYKDTKPAWRLIKSCEQRGIPLHLYGVGETFQSWWDAKVVRLIEELKKLPHKYVMYTDAADTWCIDVCSKYTVQWFMEQFPEYIVISGEKKCYPLGELYDWFDCLSPYPYPNAGQFFGPRLALIDELGKLQRIPEHETNDQASWLHGIANGYINATIDSVGRCFQTMDNESMDTFKVNRLDCGNVGFNTETRHSPSWIHFNGGNKEARMEEYRELWPQS